jgi:hypothetical protein
MDRAEEGIPEIFDGGLTSRLICFYSCHGMEEDTCFDNYYYSPTYKFFFKKNHANFFVFLVWANFFSGKLTRQ